MNLVTIENRLSSYITTLYAIAIDHVSDTKYSLLPIQKGQNRICTFVYCEDIADWSSQVCNYLVSYTWLELTVPLLHS